MEEGRERHPGGRAIRAGEPCGRESHPDGRAIRTRGKIGRVVLRERLSLGQDLGFIRLDFAQVVLPHRDTALQAVVVVHRAERLGLEHFQQGKPFEVLPCFLVSSKRPGRLERAFKNASCVARAPTT